MVPIPLDSIENTMPPAVELSSTSVTAERESRPDNSYIRKGVVAAGLK